MLSVNQLQAIQDGLLDPSEAVKLDRHAGGRPKGVKNQRDSLDKALEALLKAWSGMTPREIAESEYRISVLLDGRHRPLRRPRIHGERRRAAWRAYGKREADIEHALARATPAEKRVVAVYKGQEDRIGKARKRRVRKPDGTTVDGYPVEPHPDCVPFTDNGLRMERHPNGWLAPITATGERGHAYAVPDATLAESYAAYLEDPGRESDWSGCPLPEKPEVSPAWYEHKTRRRKLLKRVVVGWYGDTAIVPIDYASCSADELLPKAVTPDDPKPVDLDEPHTCGRQLLDSAAACNSAKRVRNKHGKAGEPMYHVEGAYRRAPLASYVRRRSAGEVTPTGKDDAWCNGVHLDDLLKLASRGPSEIKLPVIQPVVEGFLPKRLDIVSSMDVAKPTSIVWFRDYEKPVRRVDLEHGLLDSIKLWAKFAVYDLYGTFEMP